MKMSVARHPFDAALLSTLLLLEAKVANLSAIVLRTLTRCSFLPSLIPPFTFR